MCIYEYLMKRCEGKKKEIDSGILYTHIHIIPLSISY